MLSDFTSKSLNSDTSFLSNLERYTEYFEAYLADLLKDLDQEIQPHASHVCLAGGKRIRPLLVYLFGSRALESKQTDIDSLMKASAVLEMVHVATLVHDDILDHASTRRGVSTVHHSIGNHSAILLGDALFSYALELAAEFPTAEVCKIVARATKRTCSGEIRQTFSRGKFEISLEQYLGFINDKTGELFKASCEVGCLLANEDVAVSHTAGELGLSLGINYQVFDDLIDAFGNSTQSSKTLRSDWSTGKITLPLILLSQLANPAEISLLQSKFSQIDEQNSARCPEILHLLEKYNILQECTAYLNNEFEHTLSLIDSLPYPETRKNLRSFLGSFSRQFATLNTLQTCNFLAF